MTKEQARALFSALLEGELEEPAANELRAALAADSELAREYEAFQATLALLKQTPALEREPDVLRGVQQRLRARSGGRFYADRFAERSRLATWQPFVIALVMLALLALIWVGLDLFHQVTLGR
jgi:anti-sigma factor RsiW